jgi:DNA (cytosine-5)-methyltransferase 1
MDAETETLIPTTGAGFDVGVDCYNGQITGDVAATMGTRGSSVNSTGPTVLSAAGFDVAHTLRGSGFDASEDGTGRGTPLVPVAFSCKDHGADASDIAPTLRSMGHDGSHANGGGQVAVAFAHQAGGIQTTLGYDPEAGTAPTLAKCQTPALHHGMAVRRLAPRECERLQGFDDDYTLIPWRTWQDAARKGVSYEGLLLSRGMTLRGPSIEECPDGPRYKALGNSMAVPCMRWIGERIDRVAAELERRVAA